MTLRTDCRALLLDLPATAIFASGWTFDTVETSTFTLERPADCLVVDAATANPAIVAAARARLPVVALAGGAAPNEAVLDLADGYIIAGDDAATMAFILDTAAGIAAPPGVRDLSDGAARTLGALGAEAGRIAEALQSLAARALPDAPEPLTASTVRRLIRLRRDRERYLPAMLFADPAWDMLLDLAAARLEGVNVPVSSLCIAAAVPTTTALRWIRTLGEAGLFERHTDPRDARRTFVRLTDAAADAMFGWLRAFAAALAQG